MQQHACAESQTYWITSSARVNSLRSGNVSTSSQQISDASCQDQSALALTILQTAGGSVPMLTTEAIVAPFISQVTTVPLAAWYNSMSDLVLPL
jgi:D-serine deaminase-like pyridoxal phosphate-dependent protein